MPQTQASASDDIIASDLLAHTHMLRDLEASSGVVRDIAQAIVDALRSGNKVLVFGNGGSAADAQHMVAELVGRFDRERRGLPALALTTNSSNLTAISNDYGYDQVFARQVEALGRSGDVAVGISTSGRSSNVVLALDRARELGLVPVGLTGSPGSDLRKTADLCLAVGNSTQRAQEGHIIAIHIICRLVDEALFGSCATSDDNPGA